MTSPSFTAGLVVVVALAAAGATTTPAAGGSCASKVGDGEVLQRTADAIVFLSQQRFTVNPNTVVACWRSSGRTVELGKVIYDQRQIPRASQKLYQFRFAGRFAAFVVGYDRVYGEETDVVQVRVFDLQRGRLTFCHRVAPVDVLAVNAGGAAAWISAGGRRVTVADRAGQRTIAHAAVGTYRRLRLDERTVRYGGRRLGRSRAVARGSTARAAPCSPTEGEAAPPTT